MYSFIKNNPPVFSALIIGLCLLGGAFILRHSLSQFVFYANTKSTPFVFQNQQAVSPSVLPESASSKEPSKGVFEVFLRQDSDGKLYAVWDASVFNVVSIAISEAPGAQAVKPSDPLFSIRSISSYDSLKPKDFLKSPYKIGDAVVNYKMSPKEFAPEEGHSYVLQALHLSWTDSRPQVAEFQYPFTYRKSKE